MAKKKAEKTPVQLAADKAREHYKAAKEKSEKAPNNDVLKNATKASQEKMREAIAAECRERFLRVGAIRVTKAIKALETLRQVANPRSYQFTEDDVGKALARIKREYEATALAFETALKGGSKEGASGGFSFE
ncbi:MAG: hypothetical protein KGJ13_12875 [Patescibacteria group bacterium]|nr:hypothetical protein [Patescibacteria group bacterium]